MNICNYCEINEISEINSPKLCNCPSKQICESCLELILSYETHCNDCKCSYKVSNSSSKFVSRIKHDGKNYRLTYSLDSLGRKQGVCKIYYELKSVGDYNPSKKAYNSYIILQPFIECTYKDDVMYGNYYEYYKINNSVSYSSILYKAGIILCANGPLKFHIDYSKRLKIYEKPKKRKAIDLDLSGL